MDSRSLTLYGLISLVLWILTVFWTLWRQAEVTSFALNWTDRDLGDWLHGAGHWRDVFNAATPASVANTTAWGLVLRDGLKAVGCDQADNHTLGCSCLRSAHALAVSSCIGKSRAAVFGCFMNSRPVQTIRELSFGVRPYLWMFQVNVFGALAGCVALSKTNEKVMLPYNLQIGVALLSLVVFSVFQPSMTEWIPLLVLSGLQVFLSWLTRRDAEWWSSQFQLLYALVLPMLVVVNVVLSNRRDVEYAVLQLLLAWVLVFAGLARSQLHYAKAVASDAARFCGVVILLLAVVMRYMTIAEFGVSFRSGMFWVQSTVLSYLVVSLYSTLQLMPADQIAVQMALELFARLWLTCCMLNEL